MKNQQRIGAVVVVLAAIMSQRVTAAETVFDPTNLTANLQQVAHHLELINRLDEEIRLQLQMLENWHFSQLEQMLARLDQLSESLAEEVTVAGELEEIYATAVEAAAVVETGIDDLTKDWLQRERQALVQAKELQAELVQSQVAMRGQVDATLSASNNAPGATAALQAGNELLGHLTTQVQALSALEIAAARLEQEAEAAAQARAARKAALHEQLWRRWPGDGQRQISRWMTHRR